VRARRLFAGDEPDAFSATDDRDMLRRALATLPERQREALVLIEWLGMTDQQAGKILGIKPGTVRVNTSRARRSLRNRLGDRGDE
jgi:RNA polymerase sigma-70 factor (ECF subfamily)